MMNEKSPFNYMKELQKLKDSFNFDFIALALAQPIEHYFVHKWEYTLGNRSDRFKRIMLKPGKGIAGHVFKTGKALLVHDVEKTIMPSELFNYPVVATERLKSFGAIPLYQNGRVKGVLLGAYRERQQMTMQKFSEFKQVVDATFGSYYTEDMVKR